MQLVINVPLRSDVINGGYKVSVSSKGKKWSKNQFGSYVDERGVYIHHSNGTILYVGSTVKGQWGTFGERLRREFQEKASNNSKLFQLLKAQKGQISSYLLSLEDINMMVDGGPMSFSKERKALIMEQVLIGLFDPKGNKT